MRHLANDDASRAAERTLYRNEARLRGILETSDAAFASIDAEGLILDWNGKADEDAEGNNLGERPISIEAVQNKPKDLPRNGRREHTKCSPVLPMRSRYC